MARSRTGGSRGPKNLASNASLRVKAKSPRASAARSPRGRRPALASAGYGPPPGGGGGGSPKATSSFARPATKTINKPKTGRPRAGLGKPKADFPPRI